MHARVAQSPDDIKQLFADDGKDMSFLSHKLSDNSNDHCVLAFDSQKYQLVEAPIYFALDNKKPGILAKLSDKVTGEIFILGSIHHPGGNHHMINDILNAMLPLQDGPETTIPFFIAGDYNNTQEFYLTHPDKRQNLQMIYPKQSTMAGSDFNNLNKSIDAILTNVHEHQCQVNTMEDLPISPPASTAVIVNFEKDKKTEYFASPRFLRPVKARRLNDEIKSTLNDTFALSNANRGPVTVI